jgi:CRP/FNR family cyclic AMP-dependent transcriptional regulator
VTTVRSLAGEPGGKQLDSLEDDPFAGATVLGVLDESDRKYLAERSRSRRIAKGQILFSEGDASDSVLVLVSGHMKVLTYSRDGSEFIVNAVMPGETMGEVGVLSGCPRSATIQATEASVVLSLPGSVIIDLISERPVLAVALLQRLSHMVRRMTGVATDLVFLDLKQRVAKYLLERDSGGQGPARPNVTQSQLAANIGASRQRVNACLREFHKQGWISMESRGLRVLDRQALIQVISF